MALNLLTADLAGPAPRAATLRMLADTKGIAVDPDARDDRGRAAVKATYRHESLYLDPATSQLLEDRYDYQGGNFSRTIVVESRVVDAVPKLRKCRPYVA